MDRRRHRAHLGRPRSRELRAGAAAGGDAGARRAAVADACAARDAAPHGDEHHGVQGGAQSVADRGVARLGAAAEPAGRISDRGVDPVHGDREHRAPRCALAVRADVRLRAGARPGLRERAAGDVAARSHHRPAARVQPRRGDRAARDRSDRAAAGVARGARARRGPLSPRCDAGAVDRDRCARGEVADREGFCGHAVHDLGQLGRSAETAQHDAHGRSRSAKLFTALTAGTILGFTLAVVDTEQPVLEDAGKPIVVWVDDALSNLRALARVLGRRFTVLTASSGLEALDYVQAHPEVACVLADLRMPGLPGAQLLARVAELRPLCRRAVVTGYPESEELIKAINDGHLHYVITKPWKLQDLLQTVDQLVHMFRLERDNARLVAELRQANQQLHEHERVLVAQLESRGREISAATEQLAQMGIQLDALTLRDGLTGLYTHRAFQERLREECARALRYGQPMSLLIADIDGFATVNYDLGYQVGDEILRRIAAVLQEDDAADRPRGAELVARYSGEEFVVLMPETGKPGALTKAARLRDAVAVAEMPGGRGMTVSIGVASLPDDAADPEGMLTAAEAAVRGAKRGGPRRGHLFSAGEDPALARAASRQFTPLPQLDRFRPS